MKKILSLLCAAAMMAVPTSAVAGPRCSTCRYDVKVTSVYDGDTFSIQWPGLPAELNPVSIRVRGIDTPERAGKCDREKALALQARALTVQYLNSSAGYARLGDLTWDKYGGRFDADVYIGTEQKSLASMLIASGLARPYTGGFRASWCN